MGVVSAMRHGMVIVVLRAVHYRNSGLRFKDFIRTVIWIMSGMVSNLGFGGSMVMRFLPLIVQVMADEFSSFTLLSKGRYVLYTGNPRSKQVLADALNGVTNADARHLAGEKQTDPTDTLRNKLSGVCFMKRMVTLVALLLFGFAAVPSAFANAPVEGRIGRAEVRYMEGMIDHHQMAIDMALDCLARTNRFTHRGL